MGYRQTQIAQITQSVERVNNYSWIVNKIKKNILEVEEFEKKFFFFEKKV